jgi:pimeloyl-ACP methyl ester carboxylesterase
VHVKVKAPSAAASQPSAALHCYHGFGSNTWSWSLVQQTLADRLNALVTAHDMPGFGLTERCGGRADKQGRGPAVQV